VIEALEALLESDDELAALYLTLKKLGCALPISFSRFVVCV
jgi:hypothetical protein